MKAAWYKDYGAAADVLRIGERPNPKPAPGEVLVRLHASGTNPSDVKKRQGAQPALDHGWVIPHSDGAGVIEAVGAEVSQDRIGERVWVYQAQYQRRFGTAAEYVALPVERAVKLPDNASFAVGACMGIPAMTAHRCVFADGSVAGKSVLITG
ncbi:MAG: alcohol dehydrogenase catalytic domain-containing protein, partial [Gammaproteobacteria bacterium]|nr:alcohol dehydrogenase catalytic domain-containing protein [Gammaproteobacteria bacterium]